MTYDPIDTNDDGVVDADVDNQSVSTEDIGIIGESGEATTVEPQDTASGGIQEAHDAAAAGDTLILKPNTTYTTEGTYSDGAIIDITKDDITLIGFGSGSLIQHDSSTTASGEGVRLIEVRGDDVTFKNFRTDGDYQNAGAISDADDGHNIAVYGNDFHMEGVRSYYSTGDGIEPFIDSKGGTVVGCHFKENYEQNVHFNSCENWAVTGCVMEGEINNGMVSTYAGDGYVTKDCVLSNNIIKNGSVTGVQIESGDGEVTGFVSEGNIIRGMTNAAVRIKESKNYDARPSDITVNDYILGGSGPGVKISTGNGLTIGGEIKNVSGTAVEFDTSRADATNIDDVEITATIKNCGDGGFTPAIEIKHEDLQVSDVHIAPERIVNDVGNQNNAVFVNDAGTGSFADVYVRGGWYDPSHTAVFNMQEPITAITNTEPRYATDLSQYGDAQPGTEMWSDGTTGTAGPHKFDGSTWHGFAQASGSTVTP